jgi:tetratricopeptide (TPR) repeat protein
MSARPRPSSTCRSTLQHGWLLLSILLASFGCSRLHAQDTSAGALEPEPSDAPAAADAQPPTSSVDQATTHFERGVEFYEDGDYRAALLEFQRAYALQHAYQLLYNLGQVSAELRDYARAEQYFRRYLREGIGAISPERRSEVEAELTRLKARVGALRIRTNLSGVEIHVDDRLVEHAETGPVRVSAGQRHVVAEKPGYLAVQRDVDVLGGEEQTLSLVFGPPIAQTPRAPIERQSSASTLPWITGIGSAALLLGAGAVGYWAYTDASAYRTELDRSTTQSELDRLSSQSHTEALIADILLGTAIAGAAATVILLLTADSGEAPPAAVTTPRLGLGTRGLQLQF